MITDSAIWQEPPAEILRAKAAGDGIVVLPVGSMDQHGLHLGDAHRASRDEGERPIDEFAGHFADMLRKPEIWS